MNPVIIIAEAGVNHNGNIEMAKQLIDVAASAGADYVKFQSYRTKNLVSQNTKQADYQIKNLKAASSQSEMLALLELSESDHDILIAHAHNQHIKFLSTPFDLDSIQLLNSRGIRLGKIPSGEITNLPYLRAMAHSFDDLILSTGMATLAEVERAVNALTSSGVDRNNIVILHCTTEYPCPLDEVNLNAMSSMGRYFSTRYGYSDHTEGITIPLAAVALGASVIEKHFTLDKNLPGPDHLASLNPDELHQMIKSIRQLERSLGNGIKEPTPSEIKNIPIARKSIVAAKNIKRGEVLTEDNITTKRPGYGISPMLWDTVLGTYAIKDFIEEEIIVLHG